MPQGWNWRSGHLCLSGRSSNRLVIVCVTHPTIFLSPLKDGQFVPKDGVGGEGQTGLEGSQKISNRWNPSVLPYSQGPRMTPGWL